MNFSQYIITGVSYLLKPLKRPTIKLAFELRGKSGLELGGPSSIFSLKSYFPIYLFAKNIDGVNYSNSTVWEGNIEEGLNFNYYENKKGFQFISEANDLSKIKDNQYDFLISSHCLEHVANPIKALFEWNRVLKPGGILILILPDKTNTFDHKRPYTKFDHLIQDYKNNMLENDDTHFQEVIELLDINKTESIKTRNDLIDMVHKNESLRCVHHHVFDFELIQNMLDYSGFVTQKQLTLPPFHLFTYAIKK